MTTLLTENILKFKTQLFLSEHNIYSRYTSQTLKSEIKKKMFKSNQKMFIQEKILNINENFVLFCFVFWHFNLRLSQKSTPHSHEKGYTCLELIESHITSVLSLYDPTWSSQDKSHSQGITAVRPDSKISSRGKTVSSGTENNQLQLFNTEVTWGIILVWTNNTRVKKVSVISREQEV